jgi:hypothetical protein
MRQSWNKLTLVQSFLVVLVLSIAQSSLDAQVVIKEKIPIDPSNPQSRSLDMSPKDSPPSLFLVAPRLGLMQLEVQWASKLYNPIPPAAYMRVTLPETTYTATVNSFFNNFIAFWVTNYDSCQHPRVYDGYMKYSGDRVGTYPIELLFIKVPRTGDTLRFVFHDTVDIPAATLSGDSAQGWMISNSSAPQNVNCWTAPDNLELAVSALSYADTVLAGFRVKPDADTIFYGAATAVRATAINSLGKEVYIDGGTQIVYSASPTIYGKFIRAVGDTLSSPIIQNYSDARNGKVWYVSDKQTISDSLHSITITAKKNQDTSKKGNGATTIKSEWKVFQQCGQSWSDSAYDSDPGGTICSEGCALCCMAMVLSRYGYNVDPGTLNAWMKDPIHSGYDPGGLVHWLVPEVYSSGDIALSGDKIIVNKDGSPLDVTKLDDFLSDSHWSTAVQVSHGRRSHYILIIGKNNLGQYVTIDPRFPDPSTLLDYSTTGYPKGRILKIIPYWKN